MPKSLISAWAVNPHSELVPLACEVSEDYAVFVGGNDNSHVVLTNFNFIKFVDEIEGFFRVHNFKI